MDDTDHLTSRDTKWIMAEFTETLSNTNLSRKVINQTIDGMDIEIFLNTNVGENPRRDKQYKSIRDLTIITKWAETTYDAKDMRTLQRRALILTMIFGALRPAELER
ncbi:uncharacterized protein MONOS_12678 [Monocercomonoides exilis]|uniref:uncharacterized protein n=1 Tax=Monocercomonoides exilis TaxID=2049356 RepID=UPI003559E1D2|nr:hypothetical protein MONOS_12678 [Monocercomonoides exilis]|eukprot:MONOS_12678.1-p1 / transcript=MONOS_12678.1 / gene=MONOS_12678 / organism=Monocercomonoides_exilis_PA203 / gene_product=unspecified product / transcript_product=unspecified product / location=Mono_scaffold00718:20815-21135(-) / protein_length=107 / sequence_SO=supercontig / SO=protein_coding / is_pseudo=false